MIPGFITKTPIVLDEFITAVYEQFGMTNDMGVITSDDGIAGNTKVTSNLCYAILEEASSGEYAIDGNNRLIDKSVALSAIADAKEAWSAKSFGEPAIETATTSEVNFSGDFEPALAVAEITSGTDAVLQEAYVPLDSKTGITQSQIDIASLLEKLDVKFSLSGFNFGLNVTDTGFNLSVGTTICDGVVLSKSYEVSNLNISTKFDGNIATKDIREAYLRADYSLKDVTKVTGSYAGSVAVDPSKLPDGSPIDFITAAKAGALALMPGGGNKITVFSVQVPIPNCPAITISLDVNLRLSVDGKLEISIESSNIKGIEIINNKVRLISETTYGQQTYDIFADVKAIVSLGFGIKVLGYMVVDVEVSVGLGATAAALIQCDTAVYQIDTPLPLAIEIPYPTGTMNNAIFCGNIKIYGILEFSVGENSPLLKTLGLTKVWVIYDESNCILYNMHVEDDGSGSCIIVDECTRART